MGMSKGAAAANSYCIGLRPRGAAPFHHITIIQSIIVWKQTVIPACSCSGR